MEEPQMCLGDDMVRVGLTRIDDCTWQVTADWCSRLSADFAAHLSDAEVLDFAGRMLAHLDAARGLGFSAAVTPGRNNPMVLQAVPVEEDFAFFVRLTPNGHDDVCHLQMELDPIPIPVLRDAFDTLTAALVA
jgi:hypothetical protein